ncbi:MAG TPA: DUF2304 domain-containing protein [Candidatus Limnocylindrales bacterium]|nr:DUF2304 domain-containing protein [Candidatus Limnocylindrales bacterium]
MDRMILLSLIAAIAGLVLVIELVRRRKLREDYSLLWMVTAVAVLLLSLSRPIYDQIAILVGVVTYPPALMFAVAILFVLIILLHYATVLTKLSAENKRLAQELALLRHEFRAGALPTHNQQPAHDQGEEQG